ncbi:hypothetical protein KY345_00935 [Candidatus Woesearchaeota archaeon]|nr:hypothetical protein [Candidatus Woesearchaeota archaeon]
MRAVLRNLGNLLIILSIFLIFPIIIAFYYGENSGLFIITLFVSASLGLFLRQTFEGKDLDLTKGLVLAALAYIIFSFIGMIPYMKTLSFLNALFESVSGFTTTGLTTINELSFISRSLLFWRAETQWIGGIGIVVLFLFIISYLSKPKGIEEYSASVETSSSLYKAAGFSEKISATIRNTTKRVFVIYIIYTFAGIFLLRIFGLPNLEAITMGLTSISTGGFVTTNVLDYGNWALTVLCVLMVFGSVSFFLHDRILRGRIFELFRKRETKIFISLIALGFLASITVVKNPKVVLFQLISAFTTTGYSIVEINGLPYLFIAIMAIGMIIGGNIASTAGGLKIFRVMLLFKSIPWLIKKLSTPVTAIVPFRIGKNVVEEEDLVITQVLFTAYVLMIILGSVVLMILGYSFLDSSFQTISALGTVGLQTIDIGAAGIIVKLILMACMLLGRLEIFPVLVLIRRLFVK